MTTAQHTEDGASVVGFVPSLEFLLLECWLLRNANLLPTEEIDHFKAILVMLDRTARGLELN